MSEIKSVSKRFIRPSARRFFEYCTLKSSPRADSSRENEQLGTEAGALPLLDLEAFGVVRV